MSAITSLDSGAQMQFFGEVAPRAGLIRTS